jgi:hypothetical protein
VSVRFSVRLASQRDNHQLLELSRLCPMEGAVSLYIDRSPDFFALSRIQGDPVNVVVAEDNTGDIVACASLAHRQVYIDGQPVKCMYGGDLRVAPRARHTNVIRQVHDLLRSISQDLNVELWHASIMAANRAARVLGRNHLGMPIYRPVGPARFCVVSFLLAPRPAAIFPVRPATVEDIPSIVELLNQHNRRLNFAPVWNQASLEHWLSLATGLSIDRFVIAYQGQEVLGVLASWDQSSFQRIRILNYGTKGAAKSWLYNALAFIRQAPALPKNGESLSELHITHIAVRDDDPRVFQSLLSCVLDSYRRSGYHALTFGLAEGHPLLLGLNGLRAMSVSTVIYAVAEPGSVWEAYDFSQRLPYYEASHT